MNYTRVSLLAHIRGLGLHAELFMLIGVRSKADKPNEFDDKFYLVSKQNMFVFSCTTNPGTNWLQNAMNPKGTAVLKPGKYWYKLGTHKGYEALVQSGPVTVYRDNNKDLKSDTTGPEDTGYFGINIHRANETAISKLVALWSAGCQVLNNPADFKLLLDECKASGLKEFPYYLINEY